MELLQENDPHLGIHHCIALEDSVPGVAAAVASGVTTVAVPHIVPLPEHHSYELWDTLSGRGVAELQALLPQARAAGTAAASGSTGDARG